MEKIEAGEYVRYESGLIRKVTRIIPIYENGLLLSNSYYIEFDGLTNIGTYKNDYVEKIVTKHSKNIIDLIEVGDYVNGDFVVQISKTFGYIFVKTTYYDELTGEEKYQFIKKEDIKTILTHEQYENNCYRLEE